jgi:hypothetical protein
MLPDLGRFIVHAGQVAVTVQEIFSHINDHDGPKTIEGKPLGGFVDQDITCASGHFIGDLRRGIRLGCIVFLHNSPLKMLDFDLSYPLVSKMQVRGEIREKMKYL